MTMTPTSSAPIFRYEDQNHSYFLDGVRVPSVTQLVEMGGLLGAGAQFYTEASRDRGQAVHLLTADYDLGALEPNTCDSPHRGYLLAYVAAVKAIKPTWDEIEIAEAHPELRFAGRIDRAGAVFRRRTVCEIKSAVKAKHHAIQTALQAILKARAWGLPPAMIQRLTIYVKDSGRYVIEEHTDARDFDVAYDLLRRFAK